MQRWTVLLALLVFLTGTPLAPGLGAPAGAAPAATTAEGTIASAGADAFVVTTAAGPTQVRTTAGTRVLGETPVGLDNIKVGDLVGIEARKEANGSLTAVSIHILPAAMRAQFRQAQFPMENGNIMTNAAVTETVQSVSGRTLTLAYPAGTAKIDVPPSAAIQRLAVMTRAALKPGARVTVRGTANADGSLTATSITVEEGR